MVGTVTIRNVDIVYGLEHYRIIVTLDVKNFGIHSFVRKTLIIKRRDRGLSRRRLKEKKDNGPKDTI